MGEILKPWWRIYVLNVLKSLWRKFLKRVSDREQSVGPLLPFLCAWESEPVSLSSCLGVRLNLGLAKGKGALLRSKVSGEVLSWPFHPLKPWLWSHVPLLCGWYLWNYPWLQPAPLIFYILAVVSAVSSSRLLGPLLLTSGWPLPPPVHPPEGAFWVQSCIALLATSSSSSQHWRLKTLCGHTVSFTPWPQISFPELSPSHPLYQIL